MSKNYTTYNSVNETTTASKYNTANSFFGIKRRKNKNLDEKEQIKNTIKKFFKN